MTGSRTLAKIRGQHPAIHDSFDRAGERREDADRHECREGDAGTNRDAASGQDRPRAYTGDEDHEGGSRSEVPAPTQRQREGSGNGHRCKRRDCAADSARRARGCERDRQAEDEIGCERVGLAERREDSAPVEDMPDRVKADLLAVSYTHLTLPTIYSV